MTLRSRPVLDRKHRPRWQDELRTQQLTVIAFAVAIALALGIFGASAWSAYWDAHIRPVTTVAGMTFDRSDLTVRERIITAELVNQASELEAQLGGPRDSFIQQQLQSLNQAFSQVTTGASESITDGAILASRAADFGVEVTDLAIDQAVALRLRLSERVSASLILIDPLPDDAEPGDEPTDEQVADALDAAEAARERIEGGEAFATVAREVSDDTSASSGGVLGWFFGGDIIYGEYFTALEDAEVGDIVGPIETRDGVAVLGLVARREATSEGGLRELLADAGVGMDAYREYVAGDVLADTFRRHFADEVVESPAAQRRVAKIFIAAVTGAVVPQERARHILIQPDPELESQAEATDEQWNAALEEARQVHDLLAEPDADWWAIAEEYSDDTGSGTRGGDLGWYDPTDSPFVDAFAATLGSLDVGDLSEPVRTDFGVHVIQKTGVRETPFEEAQEIAAELADDPERFEELARDRSEDYTTAEDGGEVGWVAQWELTRLDEDAIFALTEDGAISDPIDSGGSGITIFRLLESSESREIEGERLETIRNSGVERWLDEVVRSGVERWIDPAFAPSSTGV